MNTTKTLLRALPILALASPAIAHERWVRHELLSDFDRSLFETFNVVNLGTLAGVLLLAALLLLLSAKLRARAGAPLAIAPRLSDWATAILGILTGCGLLLLIPAGQFLAPDLQVTGSVAGQVLLSGSALVGVLLVIGLWARVAAWGLLALYLLALIARPFESFDGGAVSLLALLNYVDVVGIAIFIGMLGRGALSLDRRLGTAQPTSADRRRLAVGILRIVLGATLILLGLQKFFLPELPMGVLQNYADQIYQPIARLTGASPEAYVFAASVVETTVGVVVLMGVFTRLWILIVTILFAITAAIFKAELLGHLPLVGVAVVLLVEGAGGLRLDSLLQNRMRSPRVQALTTSMAGLLLLLCGLPSCGAEVVVDELPQHELTGAPLTSESGRYQFELTAAPEAIALGEFFTVSTRILDPQGGAPPTSGALKVNATMPEHGHGMVTLPVTTLGEDGLWLTEGCKLHMFGRWVFELEWQGPQGTERASFEYQFTAPERG